MLSEFSQEFFQTVICIFFECTFYIISSTYIVTYKYKVTLGKY